MLSTMVHLTRIIQSNISEHKENKTHEVKNATYSLKLENIRYVELRATHFESKSAFINHLIETDMADHPDIVEMAKQLSKMKERYNCYISNILI